MTARHRSPSTLSPSSSIQSLPQVSPASTWSPLRYRHRDNRVARHLFRETPTAFNLPSELWLFLQNLDRRLEHLTGVVEEVKSALKSTGSDTHSSVRQSHSADAQFERQRISPTTFSSYSDQSTEPQTSPILDRSESLTSALQQTPARPVAACGVTYDRLMEIRGEASSIMNFAVRLLREICPAQELIGRNICGVRGKPAVDVSKVEQIRALVHQYYPAPPVESVRNWRECRKAMDSFLRKLPRPN